MLGKTAYSHLEGTTVFSRVNIWLGYEKWCIHSVHWCLELDNVMAYENPNNTMSARDTANCSLRSSSRMACLNIKSARNCLFHVPWCNEIIRFPYPPIDSLPDPPTIFIFYKAWWYSFGRGTGFHSPSRRLFNQGETYARARAEGVRSSLINTINNSESPASLQKNKTLRKVLYTSSKIVD